MFPLVLARMLTRLGKMLQEMRAAMTLAQEDVSIGVIILCGEGPNAFCSGPHLTCIAGIACA